MILRPFFSFFGGKWSLSKYYPTPEHETIIESFAGSAGYATRFSDRRVILVERDPDIAALWRYLISVRASEVLSLPTDVPGCVDDLDVSAEARILIGFWVARGVCVARKNPTSWMRSGKWPNSFWGESIRARIARQVECIRHWRIVEGDYTTAPDVAATWLIDPPYAVEGRHYRFHEIDYSRLSSWVVGRQGTRIVCEADGATWMPFTPFRQIKSLARSTAKESLYVTREEVTRFY